MTLNVPLPPLSVHRAPSPDLSEQTTQPKRRVDVVHLAPNGDLAEFSRMVPATAPFESAFAAFARGTIMQTANGQKAVEDILPGDILRLTDGGAATLLWRGAMMIVPQHNRSIAAGNMLTRINADAFGLERPATDLVLGPYARICHCSPAIKALTGQNTAFVPAADFIDGLQVIALTPQSAVQVFHLGFADQHRITANGIEVETFHPGAAYAIGLRQEALRLYLSLFPHVSGVEGFGTQALPRLRKADLDLTDAA